MISIISSHVPTFSMTGRLDSVQFERRIAKVGFILSNYQN
jgi:hypothetical protein